jgi:hypothetical protein
MRPRRLRRAPARPLRTVNPSACPSELMPGSLRVPDKAVLTRR